MRRIGTTADYSVVDYPEDVRRIVAALARLGWEATPVEAEDLWDTYSDTYAAGWLFLPEQDGELDAIIQDELRRQGLSEGEVAQ